MTFREKLLDVVDTDTFRQNLSEDILLDIVLEQLKATKRALNEARAAVIREGMAADQAKRDAHEHINRVRSDVTYFAAGDFYFTTPTDGVPSLFRLLIADGRVQLFRRHNRIDYVMIQITADEYARMVARQ